MNKSISETHFKMSNANLFTISESIHKNISPQEIITLCKNTLLCEDIVFLESINGSEYSYYYDSAYALSKINAIQYIKNIQFLKKDTSFSFYIKNQNRNLNTDNNYLILEIDNSHLSQKIFIFIKGNYIQKHIISNKNFSVFMGLLKLYFANRAYSQKNIIDNIKADPLYKQLAQQAPVLINIISPDLKFTLWNQECERLLGWKHSELQQADNQLLSLFTNLTDYNKVKNYFLSRPEKSTLTELTPICKDGSMLTTLWTSIQLPDYSYINIGINVTEQRKSEQILQKRANTDNLTQCLNRVAIFDQLETSLKTCKNSQIGFCVFLLDIDHFKIVNDTWGHMIGDKALQHFCHILQLNKKQKVHIGRFGGEEFLLILETSYENEAIAFDEQIRASLASHPLYEGKNKIELNYSGGFVMVKDGQCSKNLLLSDVDHALYHAKEQGRGRTLQAHTSY